MNKNFKNLVALAFATLVLGSCQTRDASPTQPAHDSEVELAARLVAAKAPPAASRVRLRLSIGSTLGQWIDSAYAPGKEILLGLVPLGAQVTLDVRAYSLGSSNTDTLWKWFARASEKADSALAIQVLEAEIKTVPTSAELKTSGGTSNKYALPAGSRYTLDGTDPKSGAIATGSEIAVPAGKTLRAILRIVIAGTTDTLVGDTLNVSVPDTVNKPDPVVPPKAPSFTSEGKDLLSQLAVGSSIRIQADTGAKLAYTTDTSEPKCLNALGKNEHTITIGADLAGKTLILKAVSCRDTSVSTVARRDVAILKPGEAPRQEVVIPGGYDSTGTEKKNWKDSVIISFSAKSSNVFWNLVVKAGVVTTNVWPALPTAQSWSGTVLKVDSALLKDIPATDSVATVLVVAVLFDSANKVQDTAFLRWIIRVPYTPPKPVAPKAPVISVNETELPDELVVGANILVQADGAAKLAYTTDRTAPDCKNASSSSSATIKIDSSMAGDTLVIRALSCRDALTSTETRDTVRIAKPSEVIKERISVLAAYKWDNSTAKQAWTDNVTLSISSKSALVWNLRVLPFATNVEAAAWNAVGIPDTSSRTGAGTNLGVSKELLSAVPVTDSVATVLAVVVLYDSTKSAIDTARLRWSIEVPVTPMPKLSVARTPDKLVFSWPVTETTADARVWYLIGSDTPKVSGYVKGVTKDSFIVNADNGIRVKVGVVSVSKVTGRASGQALLDTVALLPPRKPGFTVSNIDTVEGTVEIVLDAATRAEQNTVWKAGYASTLSSGIAEYTSLFDESGKCVVTVNAGGWDFGVQATRDGMVAAADSFLQVKRTRGVSPGKVLGLKVARKDSSTVVWSWTKSGAREYRVLLRRDGAMQNHFDTVDCLDADKKNLGNVDSFKVSGLANDATVSLAVVALAGTDSAAGNAEPVFNTAKTLNPPLAPVFTAVNSNHATGEVTVSITSPLAGATNWYVGFDTTGGSNFVDSRTATSPFTKAFALNGTINVQVKAERDGYTKTTRKSLAVKNTNLVAPKPPSGLEWVRTTNSVTLEWAGVATHRYRLFWDISSSTDNIDTAAATTKKTSDPLNPYMFALSPGQRVRVAIQTLAGGTDSTKPSALTYASQATLSAQEPVVTITPKLTSAATRTVTFSWASVTGAVKYKYSTTTDPGTVKDTAANSVTFTYLPGTQDVSFSIQAVNADGVASTATTSTLHIPQNRGSTNLAAWDVWTTGTKLTIQGRASSAITGTAPDSVYVRFWNKTMTTGIQTWSIPYAQLGTFSRSVTLDGAVMNAGNYEVAAQFRWTSGALKGDTTNYDFRQVSGWSGPAPTAFYQIEDGKMKVGVASGGLDAASRTGWNLRVLANYNGIWVDIVSNADKTTYPNIAEGGFGHYPLGATQLKVYSDSGVNTSVEHIVPILPEDSILIGSRYYPVVLFGAKRWITRPMNTLTTDKYCADKTISPDCGEYGRLYTWLEATGLSAVPDSGDHQVQGVCPTGWRIPYSSDFIALFQTIAPAWTWGTKETYDFEYDLFPKVGFGLGVNTYSWEANVMGGWMPYQGMWSATTGNGGNKGRKDRWFLEGDYVTGIGRTPEFVQYDQVFCIEQ